MTSATSPPADGPTGGPVAVGIDVGGTKLLAAAVTASGQLLGRQRTTSPRGDAAALLESLTTLVAAYPDDLPVGIGIAGIVDADGTLRYGPNLDLHAVALGARLRERLGRPVRVANDANVALVAEAGVGAAAGAHHAVMLTLGTGVGGAAIVGGVVLEGASGFAGELGHLVVEAGGRRCPCGNLGCLEAYASGTAIGRRAAELLAADAGIDSSLRAADRVDGRAVSEAAVAGDAFALSVLTEAGEWLGVGLVGLVNAFDPEVIVVGGGAATLAAPIVIPPAEAVLADGILGRDDRQPPPVVHATLGDDAGVIGAALLARDERPG